MARERKNFGEQKIPDLSIRSFLLPKISAEGLEIVVVMALVSALLGVMSNFLGTIAFALTAFAYYFFRDPERVSPEGKNLVLAPADGIIMPIKYSKLPAELADSDKNDYIKISIFMSVFDVHVNRNPVSGKVLKTRYIQNGKFIDVRSDKDSDANERSLALVKTAYGNVAIVQIAGLVARRIVSRLHEGDEITAGERFGLIKFGSRLDLYLPADKFSVRASSGQTAVGGETILAEAAGAKTNKS